MHYVTRDSITRSSKLECQLEKNLLLGTSMIAFGVLFLLDKMSIINLQNYLDWSQIWHLWPLVFGIFGLNKMIGASNSQEMARGIFDIFLAAYLFISFEHLWGMSFSNSWPILVIGYGICLLTGGFNFSVYKKLRIMIKKLNPSSSIKSISDIIDNF